MNAIEIIALIVSGASVIAGLVSSVYLLVWLAREGLPMYARGEWRPLSKRPIIATTILLGVPVIRGLCAMVLAWQEGLK